MKLDLDWQKFTIELCLELKALREVEGAARLVISMPYVDARSQYVVAKVREAIEKLDESRRG